MLLMLHSKANWNGYCLSYLLTDRDYSGVLGIAFNGQPESDRPICGNQIVDPGEECDVGSDNEDACCYGAGELRGIQCQLKPGAECSTSQGPCCDQNCVLKPRGQRCQEENDCALGSLCTGGSPTCPEPLPKANFTPCGLGLRLCLNGGKLKPAPAPPRRSGTMSSMVQISRSSRARRVATRTATVTNSTPAVS
ncbi:Disintegrin and metalloproteinase domain-containing protein 10, partial [Ophiophagus hannah]